MQKNKNGLQLNGTTQLLTMQEIHNKETFIKNAKILMEKTSLIEFQISAERTKYYIW